MFNTVVLNLFLVVYPLGYILSIKYTLTNHEHNNSKCTCNSFTST